MVVNRLLLIPFLLLVNIGGLNAQNKKSIYSWNNLPKVLIPVFKADTFNIERYGAKPDGSLLNTNSINSAIRECSAKGGGVVLIPKGLWMSGPIVLQSNVNLHISRSAILQFTTDKAHYKLVKGTFEGRTSMRNESPISGTDLENIAITGEGIVDGGGHVWRAMGKDRVTDNEWKKLTATGTLSSDGKTWYPSISYAKGAQTTNASYYNPEKSETAYKELKDFFRPNLLVLTNCKRVLLKNTTFQNSAAWCLHTVGCENLTFDGVKVRNEPNAQNTDGIDIESCSYVMVENSTLDCGDDGICIKSGKDEEGRKRGKPSQYVVVRNNTVYRGHGGFVIGSEMSGGAHDIFVTDCNFIGTDNGLRFKTVRGRGGVVENIFIRNINMRGILRDAILFDMYYATKPAVPINGQIEVPQVTVATPQFRNFYISNVVCDGADRAIVIRGLPEMSIKEIHLENITIRANRGIEVIDAQNISLTHLKLAGMQDEQQIKVENSINVRLDDKKIK